MAVPKASENDDTNCDPMPKPWNTSPVTVIHFVLKEPVIVTVISIWG